jgi:hypothetical protein
LTYDREDDKSGEGSQTYLTGDKVENGRVLHPLWRKKENWKAIGLQPPLRLQFGRIVNP